MGFAGPTHLEPVSRGEIRKLADPKGVAPWVAVRKHLPADNGLLRCLSYESEMVGSAGNAPVRLLPILFCDT